MRLANWFQLAEISRCKKPRRKRPTRVDFEFLIAIFSFLSLIKKSIQLTRTEIQIFFFWPTTENHIYGNLYSRFQFFYLVFHHITDENYLQSSNRVQSLCRAFQRLDDTETYSSMSSLCSLIRGLLTSSKTSNTETSFCIWWDSLKDSSVLCKKNMRFSLSFFFFGRRRIWDSDCGEKLIVSLNWRFFLYSTADFFYHLSWIFLVV